MIEQQIGSGVTPQRKSYFKPIPPDKELEALNKNTVYYRRKQNRLRCCMYAKLVLQLEGCKKIERYCDPCALKAKQNNIPKFKLAHTLKTVINYHKISVHF